jgi:hypothetical protein
MEPQAYNGYLELVVAWHPDTAALTFCHTNMNTKAWKSNTGGATLWAEESNRPNRAISPAVVHKLALLRALVAALGERLNPPWWRSQFLTEVGLRAMGRLFPRTVVSASLSSVTIAARADHDRRIGVGRRYHLFRFPATLEPMIIDAEKSDSFNAEVFKVLNRPLNGLVESLTVLANDRRVKPTDGPIRLGAPQRLFEVSGIEEIAAHYRASVEASRRAFPYFEAAED